jgi:hypothetical protein
MYPRDDFSGASAALGAVAKLSLSRDALIDYALSADVFWALPGFLVRQGMLDSDWRWRLKTLRASGQLPATCPYRAHA